VIENGGTPKQRELHGTLASIAADAADWSRGGPAMLLLGEAVGRGLAGASLARSHQQEGRALAFVR